MNKKDWTTLDILLQKAGFGGYYDLIESIKDNTNYIIRNSSLPESTKKELTRFNNKSGSTIKKIINTQRIIMQKV